MTPGAELGYEPTQSQSPGARCGHFQQLSAGCPPSGPAPRIPALEPTGVTSCAQEAWLSLICPPWLSAARGWTQGLGKSPQRTVSRENSSLKLNFKVPGSASPEPGLGRGVSGAREGGAWGGRAAQL